jgi:hypothetical protein
MFILSIVASVLLLAFGFLQFWAGAMSDNPTAGDAAGKSGAITFVVGLVILIGSLYCHWHFHSGLH